MATVYDTIMQKIHRPEVICEMIRDRSMHPDKVLDAVERGLAFQRTVFGTEYDLYDITKNLVAIKKYVTHYMSEMFPKRLRDWDDDVEQGVDSSNTKRKRIWI